MNFRDHQQNLIIIGKVTLVLGLLLIPPSIFSFFFLDAFIESDLWMDIDDIEIFFLHIRNLDRFLFLIPIFYSILSVLFILSGIGLVWEKSWGKKVALVPAVLLLFEFPIGTLIGAYIIYALHAENEVDTEHV